MQCSAGGEESIGRERQFGLAACRAGGHGKQRAGRSRRRAGSHIRSAARPRTAWWQFDWRHGLRVCVCVSLCGRGTREVGGVFRTRAGMTGCSCDMLQVTSVYACDKEDGRGDRIWTHSWLMHTHTHAEAGISGTNVKAYICPALILMHDEIESHWRTAGLNPNGPKNIRSTRSHLKPQRGLILYGFWLDDRKDGLTFRGADLERLMRGHVVLFNSLTHLCIHIHTHTLEESLF